MGVVSKTETVTVAKGVVELLRITGDRSPVLFFPGGHCTAASDCGWDLYSGAGYGVISFSRPGYGGTDVGPLDPLEFAPVVAEVCEQLDVTEVAASVGVSFGGMQAVAMANGSGLDVPRLILHSCAPSVLPYPDSQLERRVAPSLFSPRVQRGVWRAIRRFVRSDSGLRMMLGEMSTLPAGEVWSMFTDADRSRARELFLTMRSDHGFVLDLAQATAAHNAERQAALEAVGCPTLVTGSRHDGGVSFEHAVSLADTIPDAELVDTNAPTHLAWIGPTATALASSVAGFLDEPSG